MVHESASPGCYVGEWCQHLDYLQISFCLLVGPVEIRPEKSSSMGQIVEEALQGNEDLVEGNGLDRVNPV